MASSLFRREALARLRGPRPEAARLLRDAPGWVGAIYWVLLGLVVAVLTFCVLGSVNQYAQGEALILVTGKTVVTTHAAGIVSSIEVAPGDMVEAETVLVRLRADEEVAALRKLEAEIEQQLARSLLNRTDDGPRDALVTLRAQRDHAMAQVANRAATAIRRGVVSDIRIRPGQRLDVGEPVMSLVDASPRFEVIALMPGGLLPELHEGIPLRLTLPGHRQRALSLRIDKVGTQAIGPAEARRFLGPELADSVALGSSVVIVQGALEATTFTDGARVLRLHDGMLAVAQVPVRRVRIVFALLPWLEDIL